MKKVIILVKVLFNFLFSSLINSRRYKQAEADMERNKIIKDVENDIAILGVELSSLARESAAIEVDRDCLLSKKNRIEKHLKSTNKKLQDFISSNKIDENTTGELKNASVLLLQEVDAAQGNLASTKDIIESYNNSLFNIKSEITKNTKLTNATKAELAKFKVANAGNRTAIASIRNIKIETAKAILLNKMNNEVVNSDQLFKAHFSKK